MDSQSPAIVYINFYDEINALTAKAFMNTCSGAIERYKPDALYFLFASDGGIVPAGVTLYSFLRSLPVKIIMHNMGAVDSSATVVFLAGEERYASPHSSFHFHGLKRSFREKVSLAADEFVVHANLIHEDQKLMSGIYLERSAFTTDEVSDLFVRGLSMNPALAMEKRFVHGINMLSIPKGAPLLQVQATAN